MNSSYKKKISIVIAAKNEGGGLEQIIKSVRPYSDDVIIIDGHSTDNTKDIARKYKIAYYLDHKKGRGDALKLSLEKVKTDVILFFDADGSHEADDIPKFVEPILKNNADLVIGSRKTGGSFDAAITISAMLRSFGSDLLVYLLNRRFNTNFTDIIYSFRAIRKSTALSLSLQADRFEIEQEMVIFGVKKGIRILEIPSREKARGWGETKLKTSAGFPLLWHLLYHVYLQ